MLGAAASRVPSTGPANEIPTGTASRRARSLRPVRAARIAGSAVCLAGQHVTRPLDRTAADDEIAGGQLIAADIDRDDLSAVARAQSAERGVRVKAAHARGPQALDSEFPQLIRQ